MAQPSSMLMYVATLKGYHKYKGTCNPVFIGHIGGTQ